MRYSWFLLALSIFYFESECALTMSKALGNIPDIVVNKQDNSLVLILPKHIDKGKFTLDMERTDPVTKQKEEINEICLFNNGKYSCKYYKTIAGTNEKLQNHVVKNVLEIPQNNIFTNINQDLLNPTNFKMSLARRNLKTPVAKLDEMQLLNNPTQKARSPNSNSAENLKEFLNTNSVQFDPYYISDLNARQNNPIVFE